MYTEEIINKSLRKLAAGSKPYEVANEYGIDSRTIYKWRRNHKNKYEFMINDSARGYIAKLDYENAFLEYSKLLEQYSDIEIIDYIKKEQLFCYYKISKKVKELTSEEKYFEALDVIKFIYNVKNKGISDMSVLENQKDIILNLLYKKMNTLLNNNMFIESLMTCEKILKIKDMDEFYKIRFQKSQEYILVKISKKIKENKLNNSSYAMKLCQDVLNVSDINIEGVQVILNQYSELIVSEIINLKNAKKIKEALYLCDLRLQNDLINEKTYDMLQNEKENLLFYISNYVKELTQNNPKEALDLCSCVLSLNDLKPSIIEIFKNQINIAGISISKKIKSMTNKDIKIAIDLCNFGMQNEYLSDDVKTVLINQYVFLLTKVKENIEYLINNGKNNEAINLCDWALNSESILDEEKINYEKLKSMIDKEDFNQEELLYSAYNDYQTHKVATYMMSKLYQDTLELRELNDAFLRKFDIEVITIAYYEKNNKEKALKYAKLLKELYEDDLEKQNIVNTIIDKLSNNQEDFDIEYYCNLLNCSVKIEVPNKLERKQ